MTCNDEPKQIHWPPELDIPCPWCKQTIERGDVPDPGLFRCPACKIPLHAKQLNREEPKLMLATSSFIFDPQSWVTMGRRPWLGDLMTPVPIEDGVKLAGVRVEPVIAGLRLLVIITEGNDVYAWDNTGRLAQLRPTEVTDSYRLSFQLRMDGFGEWRYKLGTVLDVTRTPSGYLCVHHQMPLTSFLQGGDGFGGNASFEDLQRFVGVGMGCMKLPPYAAQGNNWDGLGDDVTLDKLCEHWSCSQVVVKHEMYFWRLGKSRAWMIYDADEM